MRASSAAFSRAICCSASACFSRSWRTFMTACSSVTPFWFASFSASCFSASAFRSSVRFSFSLSFSLFSASLLSVLLALAAAAAKVGLISPPMPIVVWNVFLAAMSALLQRGSAQRRPRALACAWALACASRTASARRFAAPHRSEK